MDLSQKYIDMSREATEIQVLWLPQDGDYYYGPPCMLGCGDGVEEIILSVNMIQNVTLYFEGFWVKCPTNKGWDKFTIDLGGDKKWSGNIPRELCTWLPKQDQLQSISPAEYSINLIDFFDTFLIEHAYKEIQGQFIPKTEWQAMSMERLWLSFVMDDEFNKHWDGTSWVNNEEKCK